MGPVPLRRAHHGERAARAAAGVVDDASAGSQRAAGLGPLDHRQGHAVLHTARRVGALPFHVDLGAPLLGEDVQAHQRRISDRHHELTHLVDGRDPLDGAVSPL